MQQGNVLRVRTISGTYFTGACAAGSALTESIVVGTLPNNGGGYGIAAGGHMRTRVHDLRVLAVQNLAFAVELYGTAASFPENNPAIDDEIFLGRWEFQAADGVKDTAADDYYKYWVPGLDLSYQDMLLSGKLYVRLVIPTGAATAKLAGASGAIVLEFGMEPTQGI